MTDRAPVRPTGATPWWPAAAPPATSSRPWPWPGPWWPAATTGRPSRSSGSERGQDAAAPGRAGLPGHPAARAGHRPPPRPAGPGAPTSRPSSSWSWPRRGPSALVGRARPRVVVAVGGYASVAGGRRRAGAAGCRSCSSNVDAVPGAANRLLGRFARGQRRGLPGHPAAARGGDRARRSAPEMRRGRPGRPRGRAAARRRARAAPRTGPWWSWSAARSGPGGSTGAVVGLAAAVGRTGTTWRIYHVVGARRGLGRVTGRRRPRPGPGDGRRTARSWYRRCPTRSAWPLVYAAADVVVCRAGAMTVAELAVAGRAGRPRAAARGARRPPDGQRPGARARRGGRGARRRGLHAGRGWPAIVDGLLAEPGPAGGHGAPRPGRWAGPTPPTPAPAGRGQRPTAPVAEGADDG